MTKKIVAKTGSYTNQQGETKGRYQDIGVILSNENGDYVMLDPGVNLAGILIKQNIAAVEEGKQERSNVMCSIFESDGNPQRQSPQQHASHAQQQRPAPSQRPAPPQNQPMGVSQVGQQPSPDHYLDDDILF